MELKLFVFNPIQENTYVLWDETKECVIIDPGFSNGREFEKIDNFIKDNNLKPVRLINTHCHFDHILGVEKCKEAYNLNWEINSEDAFLVESSVMQASMFGFQISEVKPAEKYLNDGDEIRFGNSFLEVITTPGHSPGGMCFYSPESKILITGDSLFRGSIGRTDLPGGDYNILIINIKEKLLSLPDDVIVYPGHESSTTIGDERVLNPFLR